MVDRSDFVGRTFRGVRVPLDPGHVEDFSGVMGEEWEPGTGSPVPLSYTTLVAMRAIEEGVDLEEDLRVDPQVHTVMFGELGLDFHGPIDAGTELTAELEIGDVVTKRGESGEFEIITIDLTFRDDTGTVRLGGSVSAIVAEE